MLELLWELEASEPEALEPEVELLLPLVQAVSPSPRAKARDKARNFFFIFIISFYIPFIQTQGV